jgi:hypothetical protein
MKQRPCECGCSYKDHESVLLSTLNNKMETLYCKNCDKHDAWCYSYRAIKNLAWLEWLVR